MFSENLKAIRKSRGYTQEELAIKINVVRQTVSKWEKGLSVPDADVLSKIADVLEVSVSELLGAEIKQEQSKNEIAEQLAKISEQLAIKNNRSRKIWKTIGICLMLIIVIPVIVSILGMTMYSVNKDSNTVVEEYVEEIETEDIGEFE